MTKKDAISYVGGTVTVKSLEQELRLDALSARRGKDGEIAWDADVYDTESHAVYHVGMNDIEPGQTYESAKEWEHAKDQRAVKEGQKVLHKRSYRGR